MSSGTQYSRDAPRRRAFTVGGCPLVVMAVLSAVIIPLCLGCRPKPPNLTTCVRIDVQCGDGALNYFFPHTAWQKSVLNEAEREFIQSYDTWTVTDQEQIKALASRIGQGTSKGLVFGTTKIRASIVGYSSSGRRVSFSVTGGPDIITRGGAFSPMRRVG